VESFDLTWHPLPNKPTYDVLVNDIVVISTKATNYQLKELIEEKSVIFQVRAENDCGSSLSVKKEL
jgi:hypothetical protein